MHVFIYHLHIQTLSCRIQNPAFITRGRPERYSGNLDHVLVVLVLLVQPPLPISSGSR